MADTLSRNIKEETDQGKIMEFHKDSGHRKNIWKELRKVGIRATHEEIKRILTQCKECLRKDETKIRSAKFMSTSGPGERFGLDLMDVEKKFKIIIGIDYFTRKIFGKVLVTKEPIKVREFLEEVHQQLPFGKLQTDNGREFANKTIGKWTKEKGVKHILKTPHYHAANGRVERAIRTVREGIKRTAGPIKIRLKKVIQAYNELNHRGIGMSPIEALKGKNWEQVRRHQ